MSYCRWSSMNWMCDLYCYEDVGGGWTTHVAGKRRAEAPPEEPDILAVSPEEFVKAHKLTMDALESIPLVDIELPHAGETFNDATLEEFRDRLLMLREVGYLFPDYVLDEIAEEIAERDADPTLDSTGADNAGTATGDGE